MNPKTPIVLAAFGTTSKAMDTYRVIDSAVKARFAGHPVRWAYTSRMVRAHMNKHRQANMKQPRQVLDELAAQGHAWAVVQSIHMLCGHEFYRLVDEVKPSAMRTSMGLPLLTSPADFQDVAAAIVPNGVNGNGTVSVLVGHGTDHPSWTAYPALQRVIQASGLNAHVATIEGQSAKQKTIADVMDSGANHVHLVPLMLVAGVHVREDIVGDGDSWKNAFIKAGLRVTIEEKGLGKHPAIIDNFVRHIREAMAIIPKPHLQQSVL